MFCGYCGVKLAKEDVYCPNCGKRTDVFIEYNDNEEDPDATEILVFSTVKNEEVIEEKDEEKQENSDIEIVDSSKNQTEQGTETVTEMISFEYNDSNNIETVKDNNDIVGEEIKTDDPKSVFSDNKDINDPSTEYSSEDNHTDEQKPYILVSEANIHMFSLVMMIFSVFYTLYEGKSILYSISNFYDLASDLFDDWWLYGNIMVCEFLRIVFLLLGIIGAVILVFVSYQVNSKWQADNAKTYLTGYLCGSGIVIVSIMMQIIVDKISEEYTYPMDIIFPFLLAVIAVAGYFYLCCAQGINLAINYHIDQMKSDAEDLFAEAKTMADSVQNSNMISQSIGDRKQKNTADKKINYKNTDGKEEREAILLKSDRSILLYIVLGIITCGIYSLYILYTVGRDLNIACAGDGRETAGILKFFFLTLITCGIYSFVWMYQVGNRLQDNAPRYGLNFRESGMTILLWYALGLLLCGLGEFVAIYLMLRNTNEICIAYNKSHN